MADAPGMSCPTGRRGLEHPHLDETPSFVRFGCLCLTFGSVHLSPWVCRASPCIPASLHPNPGPRDRQRAPGASVLATLTCLCQEEVLISGLPSIFKQRERPPCHLSAFLPLPSPTSTPMELSRCPTWDPPTTGLSCPLPPFPEPELVTLPLWLPAWLPSIPRRVPTGISTQKVTDTPAKPTSPRHTLPSLPALPAPHCRGNAMPPPSPGPAAPHGARPVSQVSARLPCAWVHLVSHDGGGPPRRSPRGSSLGPPCDPRRSIGTRSNWLA